MSNNLTSAECRAVIEELTKWFTQHPDKKTCQAYVGRLGYHTFHRDRMVKQVGKLTNPGKL